MPGIFGFVQDSDRQSAQQLLAAMARALEPIGGRPPQLLADGRVGLGRVDLGIVNPGPQPVWNRERTVCLLMEGELYDTDRLKQEMEARGSHLPQGDDPELALSLYQELGPRFPARLNGAFTIAIWDQRIQRLLIANDRLGLHPLYFAHQDGRFLFGSGVRCLLADPQLDRQVDKIAMAELLTFDHVLGQRTLVESVSLLPQASVLLFGDGRLQIEAYWKPSSPETYPVRPEAEYAEELLALLRQAVRRQRIGREPADLLLSGGLDSRALLAVMAEQAGPGELRTLTWGIPGSDEVRFAREAARIARSRHRFQELKAEWIVRLGRQAVRTTDGLGNIVNLHAVTALDDPSRARILVKGFLGDAMFGFGMRPRYWADYLPDDEVRVHLEAYRDYNVLSFDLPEHARLFSGSFARAVGDGVVEDYRQAMRASGSRQLSDQRLYIDFAQRVPRMTLNGVEMVRLGAAVRMPFADKDLVEFSTRVPPGLRFGRQVMVQAFIGAFPALSQVPFSPSGLPLVACARDLRIRAQRLARWHLERRGLGWLAGTPARPSKAYDRWFRDELRSWVDGVLLGPAAASRGYFDRGYIGRLLEAHRTGANHAVRLGALISLELWHQEFIDQAPQTADLSNASGSLLRLGAAVG